MPTANPRINVTLSISLDTMVGRLAAHQRVSKSQVLRELLETAEPALQRAVALMDAAKSASAEVRNGLARRLERDTEAAEDAMAMVVGRLDRGIDLVSQAEAILGKRPARVAPGCGLPHPARSAQERTKVGKNPPASNRGVKSAKRRNSTPQKAATQPRGPRR